MKIEIRAQEARGGTEFIAIPARLHLGGQRAEGVDRLEFELPEEWENMSVSLYVQHEDGKNMIPVLLDSSSAASVGESDHRVCQGPSGCWRPPTAPDTQPTLNRASMICMTPWTPAETGRKCPKTSTNSLCPRVIASCFYGQQCCSPGPGQPGGSGKRGGAGPV